MSASKKFIFIESNTSGTGELLIYKSREKNLVPIFITSDPKKYYFLPIEGLNIIVTDTNNKQELLKTILQIENVIGIYSSSEYFIEVTSWLAEKLNLPHTNSRVVATCRDKNKFYTTVSAADFTVPETKYITHETIGMLSNSPSFPVIIKPNNASGSLGVKLCENESDAKKHLALLLQYGHADFLIQEYVEGEEFSVEVCAFNGQYLILGITQKYLGDLPYCIEIGHDFPAILSEEVKVSVEKTVKRMLAFLGFDFGFCHIEFKISKGKIVIIELNPRLAGGMIPALIQKALGIDVLSLLLDLYTEKTTAFTIHQHRFASIRQVVGKKSGEITMLSYNGPIVDEVKFIKKVGEYFVVQGDFRDRLAYLIFSDNDAEVCKNKSDNAVKYFSISIEN